MNAHIPTIIATLLVVIFIPITIVQIKGKYILGVIVSIMFVFWALLGLVTDQQHLKKVDIVISQNYNTFFTYKGFENAFLDNYCQQLM